VLIAVPLGNSLVDQMSQTSYLRNGFINYLLEKRAAGIVNVTVQKNNILDESVIFFSRQNS
jgi:hypothetical protein